MKQNEWKVGDACFFSCGGWVYAGNVEAVADGIVLKDQCILRHSVGVGVVHIDRMFRTEPEAIMYGMREEHDRYEAGTQALSAYLLSARYLEDNGHGALLTPNDDQPPIEHGK